MSGMTLAALVTAAAEKFAIPGVAVAVWTDGTETYAGYGVTSLEDPRPVGEHTLYSVGSISKTFTATAMMRLVAQGKVDLDAPVRRYLPELVLPNEQWTSEMTVLNLLNHTAGLDWRLIVEVGDADDALAQFVARLADFEQLAAPGTRTSYSQVGYNLAGRIIEKVTGLTFERAVETLVLEPLGLRDTLYALDDIMARPAVAMGHNADENGQYAIARQWKDNRANNPGGGVASSPADLLLWARFHLGDGRAPDGTRVLPGGTLHQMQGLGWQHLGTVRGAAVAEVEARPAQQVGGRGGDASARVVGAVVLPLLGDGVLAVVVRIVPRGDGWPGHDLVHRVERVPQAQRLQDEGRYGALEGQARDLLDDPAGQVVAGLAVGGACSGSRELFELG